MPDITTLEGTPGSDILLPTPSSQVLQVPKGTLRLYDRDHQSLPSADYGKLSIQFHDAYRYQRELSIGRVRDYAADATGHTWAWEVHAYRHPGLRCQTRVSQAVAKRLIERIWELARDHTILLFNAEGEGVHGPVGEGFVHFHEQLLWGATPSVALLP